MPTQAINKLIRHCTGKRVSALPLVLRGQIVVSAADSPNVMGLNPGSGRLCLFSMFFFVFFFIVVVFSGDLAEF